MSEHTAGPWMIGEPGWLSKDCYSLVNPKGNVIAVQILVKEDAELMRAAPELLAACEALLARCEVLDEEDCSNRELAQARAAIAKARGGA